MAKIKLTPELQKEFCKAIEKGYSIDGACGAVGIVKQTYYNWYNTGKDAKSGIQHDFYCAVEAAKAKATHFVEGIIIDQLPENPSDAKWWLTKRRPDIYADRQINETKLDATIESEITVNLLERVKAKRRELNDSNSN